MPETSIDGLSRDLRMMFTRGKDAFQRDNFDYAVDLFNQVLLREPGCYECRKLLRIAQLKKADKKAGFFKRLFNTASASPLLAKGEIALHSNPIEALSIAEEILNSAPTNSAAHRLIMKAAASLEMPNTALPSLEVLYAQSPDDREIGLQFAQALGAIGQPGRGAQVLQALCQHFPNDPELGEVYKNLTASTTMSEGGYDALAEGTGSYRDILKNAEEAKSLEEQSRVQKTVDGTQQLIDEYEARLKSEPNNLRLIKSLAELHTEKNQFDQALGYYDRLKNSPMGNDPSLDQAIAATVLRKYDFQISQLDATALDYHERVAAIQAEKETFQLTECQQRAERYPTDLQIRFELGQLYLAAGKVGQAIQEFQKSQSNPNRRFASMNCLAQCYAARAMFDLAARALQNALNEKPAFDEEKKELTYNLGCVFEKMNKKEQAIEQFKLIYETDIGYKDVAAKVDAYYASKG